MTQHNTNTIHKRAKRWLCLALIPDNKHFTFNRLKLSTKMQRGKRTQILLFIPAKMQIEKPMLILFIPFCQNANRETYADFFSRFCQNTLKKFYANVSFHSCQNVNKKSTQMLLFIPTKCSVLSIIIFTAIITHFLQGKNTYYLYIHAYIFQIL